MRGWEKKGRSRSRASRKPDTDTKGTKGGKGRGGDKGGKRDSKDKGAYKGDRSESEVSRNTRGRSNPKHDVDSRRHGDWICICGDYKYSKKTHCNCGTPNATRENRLAMRNGDTQTWDPPDFDENDMWQSVPRQTKGKGAAHPQETPASSSSASASTGPRWPPLAEAERLPQPLLRQPQEQQRMTTEQPRGHQGNYGDLQARTIRARHRKIVERIVNGGQILDEWVSMICDPEWMREQEQSGRRDPETRPKKSSICIYYADNRGCHKEAQRCHFQHAEWPTEIREKMLNRNVYKGPGAEEARRQQREHKAQDRAAQGRHERDQRHGAAREVLPQFQNPVIHRESPNIIRSDDNIEIRAK